MSIGTALFFIFCTPNGWLGMFILGVSLAMIFNNPWKD